MSRRLTTSEFIKKANKIHSNKYEYCKVTYKTTKTPVEIICPEHGSFWQTPVNHLQGNGCPECGKKRISQSLKTSKIDFIEKANEAHNNFYDYSKTEYFGMHKKCLIQCPIHGAFHQTPANHIFSKQGCPKCGESKKQRFADARKKTTATFIAQCSKRHQNKYVYSKTSYKNNVTPVEIECPIHGSFFQLPTNHLNLGHGCPKCAQRGFNPNKQATLYYIKDLKTGLYKIGVTNKSVEERFGKEFCENRTRILLEQTYKNGDQAYQAEQEILTAFNYYRIVNENWPEEKGGKTEFFDRDILEIDDL